MGLPAKRACTFVACALSRPNCYTFVTFEGPCLVDACRYVLVSQADTTQHQRR